MRQERAAVDPDAFAPAACGKSARRLAWTHLPPRHARRVRFGKTRGPATRTPAVRGKSARRLTRAHLPPQLSRRVRLGKTRGPATRPPVACGKGARRLTRTHLPPRLSQRAPDELLDCTRSFSARRERARTGRVAQRASGLARGCFIGAKRAASSDESARTRKSGACAMSATGTLPAPLPSPAARGAGRVPLGFARPFPPEPRKGPRAICLLFRDFVLNFEEKF